MTFPATFPHGSSTVTLSKEMLLRLRDAAQEANLGELAADCNRALKGAYGPARRVAIRLAKGFYSEII